MIFEEAVLLRNLFQSQVSFEECKALFDAVLETPAGDVVEVGSATGGTTIVLIGAAGQKGKTVYSIDPYPDHLEGIALEYTPGIMQRFKKQFKTNILDGVWKNIIQYNESVVDCIDAVPDNLSVVFIDGCHELSCVMQEAELLYPKLGIKGRMYIHDVLSVNGQITNTVETGLQGVRDWVEANSMFATAIISDVHSTGGRIMLCLTKDAE